MSDKITLEDVRRLDVRPGETLLVTVRANLTPEELDRILGEFTAAMPDVRVAVVTDEIHVEVVAGETGARRQ